MILRRDSRRRLYGGKAGRRKYEIRILDVYRFIFGFGVIGLLFGIFKERSAKFVSGFNSIPRKEQELYDRACIARDMRNSYGLWAAVMLIGAVGSYFLSGYFAVAAYLVWIVLFFKDVHLDARKAFEKYRIG